MGLLSCTVDVSFLLRFISIRRISSLRLLPIPVLLLLKQERKETKNTSLDPINKLQRLYEMEAKNIRSFWLISNALKWVLIEPPVAWSTHGREVVLWEDASSETLQSHCSMAPSAMCQVTGVGYINITELVHDVSQPKRCFLSHPPSCLFSFSFAFFSFFMLLLFFLSSSSSPLIVSSFFFLFFIFLLHSSLWFLPPSAPSLRRSNHSVYLSIWAVRNQPLWYRAEHKRWHL